MSSADPDAPMGVMLGAGVGELVVAASTGFMNRHESDSARVMDCMCATVAGEVESRRGRSLPTNGGGPHWVLIASSHCPYLLLEPFSLASVAATDF